MYLSNLHTHTYFCNGTRSPKRFVKTALKLGFQSLGFSAHAPLPFESLWAIREKDVQEYCGKLQKMKSDYDNLIDIQIGLEVDYIPGISNSFSKLKEKHGLDYVIGSVHYLGMLKDGKPWLFDGNSPGFREGLAQLFDGDAKTAAVQYFELVKEMVENEHPDIIAHLDLIRRPLQLAFGIVNFQDFYGEEIYRVLQLIAEKGCMLEVNTRSMYRHNDQQPYPESWILKLANQLHIPITLTSDAHAPDELDAGYSLALEVIQNSGYTQLHYLKNGQWHKQELERSGDGVQA